MEGPRLSGLWERAAKPRMSCSPTRWAQGSEARNKPGTVVFEKLPYSLACWPYHVAIASIRTVVASLPYESRDRLRLTELNCFFLAGMCLMNRAFSQRWFAWLAVLGVSTLNVGSVSADAPPNSLTRPESLSGWKLLFDGKSVDGWRNYKKDSLSNGWKIVDGELVRDGNGAGDIVTKDKYKYFEFSVDYKISKGGNSGLMFHVTEDGAAPWHSGPEVQIQDNVDGKDPQKAGWLYQLYQPVPVNWAGEKKAPDASKPAGEWNQLFLRISPKQCEVSLNGVVYYQFKIGDKKWDELVAKSKFAAFPNFGKAGEGHICLQDHGNLVAFRNIKIRELDANGAVRQQPIDGKLDVKGTLAFPQLKWDGWQAVDEDGNVDKPLRILELTYPNGDNKRLFAMDQRGWIFVFENKSDVMDSKRFLDIQSKVSKWSGPGANEQGLLGLAFHPKYQSNGEFFVCYTKKENDKTIVARYRVSKEDSNKADPNSEEIVMEVDQPFKNHNGGSIEFGPDGFLYIALGDGGSRNDPFAAGQNRSQLLGSILRIDVDKTSKDLKYSVPSDNPFVGIPDVRPEIFAHGLRNPWRIAFDRKSGRLWCGDVGQDLWEEVNVITKGGNYGWSNHEGSHPFGNRPEVKGVSAAMEPVWEYDHSVGKSITGGRVFHSDRMPKLNGKYIYADYVSGSIWALTYDAGTGKATRNEQLIESGIPVLAFGEDQRGEVYYMIDSVKGQCIYRFE
jgi:glucose/arabinose dehydrogenase